jgi:hypothetical protein
VKHNPLRPTSGSIPGPLWTRAVRWPTQRAESNQSAGSGALAWLSHGSRLWSLQGWRENTHDLALRLAREGQAGPRSPHCLDPLPQQATASGIYTSRAAPRSWHQYHAGGLRVRILTWLAQPPKQYSSFVSSMPREMSTNPRWPIGSACRYQT